MKQNKKLIYRLEKMLGQRNKRHDGQEVPLKDFEEKSEMRKQEIVLDEKTVDLMNLVIPAIKEWANKYGYGNIPEKMLLENSIVYLEKIIKYMKVSK